MEKENDILESILNNLNESKDPPYSLVLNRKSIQKFSGGPKVALYYCEKLKKYFSFTFDEISISEDFINSLNIEDVEEIKFLDNSTLMLNKECTQPILDLYESIEYKEELNEFIQQSSENYLLILDKCLNG
jgi:hypothetical protein